MNLITWVSRKYLHESTVSSLEPVRPRYGQI